MRILGQPDRNQRRRFGLHFNLISGLYNSGLDKRDRAFYARGLLTRKFQVKFQRYLSVFIKPVNIGKMNYNRIIVIFTIIAN